MARVVSRLGALATVDAEARYPLRAAPEQQILRGRFFEDLAAAAVYAAGRIHGVPRTLDEPEAAIDIPKASIDRAYRHLRSVPSLPSVPLSRPAYYLDRFCSQLGLNPAVRAEALPCLREFENSRPRESLLPAGVAAGAICAAATALGEA